MADRSRALLGLLEHQAAVVPPASGF